jgi:hypothetical protein
MSSPIMLFSYFDLRCGMAQSATHAVCPHPNPEVAFPARPVVLPVVNVSLVSAVSVSCPLGDSQFLTVGRTFFDEALSRAV